MPETVIKIEGAKELEKKLRELGAKAEKKVYRQALRAGAKVVQAAAKAKIPVDTGTLRQNIKVRGGKRSRGVISVNCVVGDGWYQGETFYGAFLEFGHFLGKRGLADRTWVPPVPFMRPAWDEQKDNALRIVTDKIWSGIRAEAVKKA